MSKVSDYLRQHILGEVADDAISRKIFSRDNGILEMDPQIIVYPRTTNDIRKVARFSWRLAERGQVLPITVRGGGTTANGAAIGSGIILSLPTHMSQILEADIKGGLVRAQPGASLKTINSAMATHGAKLAFDAPESAATLGGALGANSVGVGALKYGTPRQQVDRLEVVLANGEVIQTERLSKRGLSTKKGLQTMEGEIYRALDTLIDENSDTIAALDDNALFAINEVKGDDGSFDLTPLIVGANGSLGVISQAIARLIPAPEETQFLAAALADYDKLAAITESIAKLEPSLFEIVDGATFAALAESGNGTPWTRVTKNQPRAMIFVEFDDRKRARKITKSAKILAQNDVVDAKIADNFEDQEGLRAILDATTTLKNYNHRGAAALPLAQNLTVPHEVVADFIDGIHKILAENHLAAGVFGHLGAAKISVYPIMNLANLGERQKVFRIISSLRKLAASFDDASEQLADGRLLAGYSAETYGAAATEIFAKVKSIFDPFGTLNPGASANSTDAALKILAKDLLRLHSREIL